MVFLDKSYRISKDVLAKEVEGELVIIPIKFGIGDLDSEMYALNATGMAVWNKLDGTRSLSDLINELSEQYDTPYDDIKVDVVEIVTELLGKGLVFEG